MSLFARKQAKEFALKRDSFVIFTKLQKRQNIFFVNNVFVIVLAAMVSCGLVTRMLNMSFLKKSTSLTCFTFSPEIWERFGGGGPNFIHDQTALYLRLASTEAESDIRESLLDTLGMTRELRAEAKQMLFVHDLVDTFGQLTLRPRWPGTSVKTAKMPKSV